MSSYFSRLPSSLTSYHLPSSPLLTKPAGTAGLSFSDASSVDMLETTLSRNYMDAQKLRAPSVVTSALQVVGKVSVVVASASIIVALSFPMCAVTAYMVFVAAAATAMLCRWTTHDHVSQLDACHKNVTSTFQALQMIHFTKTTRATPPSPQDNL